MNKNAMQRRAAAEDEAYAEINKDLPRRRALAALTFAGHLIIVFIYLTGAIGKIAEFGTAGHFEHFTNWAWTAGGIFFIFTLPAAFVAQGLLRHDSVLGTFTKFIFFATYVPLFGTATVVTVVVSVLLITDSQFLVDIFTVIKPAWVMLGNDVYHIWPWIFFGLVFIVYKQLIYFTHNRVLTYYGVLLSPVRTTFYLLYEVFIAPSVFLLCYCSLYDPHEIYKTTIWTLAGVGVALLTLSAVLVTMLIILGLYGVGTPVPYSVRYLLTNYDNPVHEKKLQ